MPRRFLFSGSAKSASVSGLVAASPAGGLTAIGLAVATGGSALATWWNSSGCAAGTQVWSLIASASRSEHLSFPQPIAMANGIYVTIVGAGSAFTAWA